MSYSHQHHEWTASVVQEWVMLTKVLGRDWFSSVNSDLGQDSDRDFYGVIVLNVHYEKQLVMVEHTCIPALGRTKQEDLNSSLVWATRQLLGQPGSYSETLTQKAKPRQTKPKKN